MTDSLARTFYFYGDDMLYTDKLNGRTLKIVFEVDGPHKRRAQNDEYLFTRTEIIGIDQETQERFVLLTRYHYDPHIPLVRALRKEQSTTKESESIIPPPQHEDYFGTGDHY